MQNRGGMGLKNYNVTDKTGPVADVVIVTGDEDLLVISDDGTIIRMDVGSISLLSRSTQGVRVMRLTGDAKVISIAPTDKDFQRRIEAATDTYISGSPAAQTVSAK